MPDKITKDTPIDIKLAGMIVNECERLYRGGIPLEKATSEAIRISLALWMDKKADKSGG